MSLLLDYITVQSAEPRGDEVTGGKTEEEGSMGRRGDGGEKEEVERGREEKKE